jgi:DNA-binding transcriptional LysR family regulator
VDFFSLRCFVEIARAGGFTRASESLGRTQPALSFQMRKLEEELGGPLFDRSASSLALTERGRVLFPRAERLLEEANDLEREVSSGDERPRGRVALAAGLTVIEGYLPPILSDFRAAHPLVRLSLLNRPAEGMYRALVDGRADLALGWLLGGRPRIEGTTLGKMRFYYVSRKGREQQAAEGAKKLLSAPLLAFEKGSDIRNYIEGRIGPLEPSLELPSALTILRYAARGFGPAIVPLVGEKPVPGPLRWTNLDEAIPPLDLELYSRAGALPSRAVSLIAAAIKRGPGTAVEAKAQPSRGEDLPSPKP